MEDGLRVELNTVIRSMTRGVLILVLMEDGLRVKLKKSSSNSRRRVLILVLMEDGLRGVSESMHRSLTYWS